MSERVPSSDSQGALAGALGPTLIHLSLRVSFLGDILKLNFRCQLPEKHLC
jgi:hypothetical protein